MAIVFTITNQKGGVGKTTTAINLSAGMATQGKKVLLIDIDPQGNATSGLGIDKNNLNQCVYDVLIERVKIEEAVVPTAVDRLEMIPATIKLAGGEVELVPLPAREMRLLRAVEPIKSKYDFIIIDCPPSLGLLTVNALTAANEVLVPIQCEFYALEGLTQLLNSLNLVQHYLNPTLALRGIVLTMYDGRTNFSEEVAQEVRKHFDKKVFNSVIPRNIKLAEAPSHGKPIIFYAPDSPGACAYLNLAKEVIGNEF
jgi:chromosome partitioning protein